MAITTSAKKAHRASLKKRVFNVRRKRVLTTATKDARKQIALNATRQSIRPRSAASSRRTPHPVRSPASRWPSSARRLLRKAELTRTKEDPAMPGLLLFFWCSRQESNLHFLLRREMSYPLNDGSVIAPAHTSAPPLQVELLN
jgi:hypothetical protein